MVYNLAKLHLCLGHRQRLLPVNNKVLLSILKGALALLEKGIVPTSL